MAPTPLRRLTIIQSSRLAELELTSTRLRERENSELNVDFINLRLEAIAKTWEDARKTHADIIVRGNIENDPYVTEGVFTRLQILCEDTTEYLMNLRASVEPPPRRGTIRGRERSPSSSSEILPSQAKLPKLDLPKFSGTYADWENFCDLFTTLVHDAPGLANATKLSYLKTCLTGPAADLVRDVATTNANYLPTWQALKTRYYNPQLIVNQHLQALHDLPYMRKECAVELRAFTDEAQRIVRALINLRQPVEHWDAFLIFTLAARLDPVTRKAWETELSIKHHATMSTIGSTTSATDPLFYAPKFEEFSNFLEKQTRTLTMMAPDPNKVDKKVSAPAKSIPGSRKILHASSSRKTDKETKCGICSGAHFNSRCEKFKAMSVTERRDQVRRARLCFNCLGAHKVTECKSTWRCAKCQKKHHTLTHVDNNEQRPSATLTSSSEARIHTAKIVAHKYAVILATAQLTLVGPQGNSTRVRALLDQGAECSLISDSIAQLLSLPRRNANVALTGLGASAAGTARAVTRLTLQSLTDPSFRIQTDALILPKLTSKLPSRHIMEIDLDIFANLPLADPSFHVPDSVDMILGADIYGQLLRAGLRKFSSLSLVAQNTALGWIVSGPVHPRSSRRAETPQRDPQQILHCAPEEGLTDALQRFWSLEELPTPASLSPDEAACEKLFTETHRRDPNGRFLVRLPWKSEIPAVGSETQRIALGSLTHMYRRFARDARLAAEYRDFMTTYERLGHMERVPVAEINNPRAWYLPHHAVIQATPTTYKIRVVFDASRKTRGNHSLNDFLMSGPPLQRDLSLILLNWRQYRYVFTADIVKMFRQIKVAQEERDFQRIVWASSCSDIPVHYRLTTVTYGTTCAPYLAIRTLLQLAQDGESRFPLGAQCLRFNTYVDDAFSGANELTTAVNTCQQFIKLLRSAGIELDKWAANHTDLLPPSERGREETKTITTDKSVKTLGVQWNPNEDKFQFTTVNFNELVGAATKRVILSNIARLFDPLGWLAPVTVTAKILMQDLWISKSGWDDNLPAEIRERWLSYCESLSDLPRLSINRWLGGSTGSNSQIHAFSDASSRAYAAAIYLRTQESDGSYRVSLLAAKTKVAPVKTISIPNLELCGAALLVKLLRHITKLEFFEKLPIFAWTDSQIVLKWLEKHPCHWKTFIANRVSYIQTELPSAIWAHVPTKENPADLATRGVKPVHLIETDLWWHGPDWLSKTKEHWPKAASAPQVLHTRAIPAEPELLTRFSSLTRLIRVVAYCLRPLLKVRRQKSETAPLPNFLTADELSNARRAVIRITQEHAFADEIALLNAGKELPKRNPLCKLNPTLDKVDNILRVGGRLENAQLSRDRKHPPILPHRAALSRLLVRHAHQVSLHGGPTLTANTVLQHAWILGRNRLVKTELRHCVTCQRVKLRLAHQMMGNLPASRVTPARPFSSAGLDYAGPIHVRTTKGRGFKSYKGYIALFVCFVTRAIHLEAVSDLKTETFIAAYRRFVGRRGLCRNLYSDNATTFQAADKELRAMFKAASDFYKDIASTLSNDGTTWTFIPPNSPHYGGLWEAGVKSVKHHLKRAIGNKTLTFEELSTLLVEIEACLNSRPLCPLNSEIDDLRALTPAHFLIGEVSGLIPDQEPPDVPESRLDRLHLLQATRNQFWTRWSAEYLQHLQERHKWREPTENFTVGQLVLLRDDRYPPAKWPLGRVTEVHLGPDGLVRVVSVKTATSTLRRHVARLCPLLTEPTKQSTAGN